MSSPKTATFRSSCSTPEAQQITPTLRVRRASANEADGIVREEAAFRCVIADPKHRQLWRDREHDPPSTSVALPERCFAPDVFRHSTPHRVVQVHHGALVSELQ